MARMLFLIITVVLPVVAQAQTIETSLSVCDAYTLMKRTRCVHEWSQLMVRKKTVAVLLSEKQIAAVTWFSRAFYEQITIKYQYDAEVAAWLREYADPIPRR